MSYFILLFLSVLDSVLTKSTGITDSSNFMIKLIENDDCGLSNEHFIEALHLNVVCFHPKLNGEDYNSSLQYGSAMVLCAEYYLINNKICEIKNNSHVLSVQEKSGVETLLKNLRGKLKNISVFCNFTQKERPKFLSLDSSDLKIADDLFKDLVGNETTCKEFCGDRFSDHVTDLCRVIIWAYDEVLSSKDFTKSIASEQSHIEVINQRQDKKQDTPPLDKKNSSEDVVNPSETSKVKSVETESILKSPNNFTSERKPEQNLFDEEIPQTGVKPDKTLRTEESPENNQQLAGMGNIHKPNIKTSLTVISDVPSMVDNLPHVPKQPVPQAKQSQNENTDNVPVNDEISKEDLNGNSNTNDNNNNNNLNNNNEEDDDTDDNPDIGLPNVENNDKPAGQDLPVGDEDNGLDFPIQKDDQPEIRPEKEEKPVPQDSDINNGVPPYSYALKGGENEGSNFFTYFVSMGVVCAVMYTLFHNKKKILALAVEGRRGRPHGGGRRRPNTAAYSKLDSNLEEAMVSNVSQASVTHVLY